uniref:Uncharacterized protein n=1 Tax=Heterorhabditis bacteriophora TaxID=37862 RepID=A0A1I7WH42_HETBA
MERKVLIKNLNYEEDARNCDPSGHSLYVVVKRSGTSLRRITFGYRSIAFIPLCRLVLYRNSTPKCLSLNTCHRRRPNSRGIRKLRDSKSNTQPGKCCATKVKGGGYKIGRQCI